MKDFFEIDKWKVIQNGFSNDINEIGESLTSLGNGHMGFRGNFEEDFTGKTLKGTYTAGVFYPDKTKVGWWKIGYPEYFAKAINSCDFLSLNLLIDDELIDINKCTIENFTRILDMQKGVLDRKFTLITKEGKKVLISSSRFTSMDEKEIGAIRYSITPLTDSIDIKLNSSVNGDVRNQDSNYDEMFWIKRSVNSSDNLSNVTMSTLKTDYWVSTSAYNDVFLDSKPIKGKSSSEDLCSRVSFTTNVDANKELVLYKYISVTTSRDNNIQDVTQKSVDIVLNARKTGFDKLLENHIDAWAKIWANSDVKIKGDDSAQQGIRFNIFHLNQTYTGKDSRLNIGPKGFTGEKYGGSTYWDTEAYCLPFFLSTAPQKVSKNLLIYRYNHLENAKINAAKLGLKGALYPMVTMNGEECHNEWEITFEEIHRNGAIAYAIYNYVNYTGDTSYLAQYGIDVVQEIARFWASRVSYNPRKQKYMILGVTGPNEYENNVNNNWYTNLMASFCLKYAVEVLDTIKNEDIGKYEDAIARLKITKDEIANFSEIAQKMYYSYDKELDLYMQQDGFMDKEQLTVDDLSPLDRPINQNWSWDKILRSVFIKQADILQGMYNFPHDFDVETKKRHFDFYEPRTVHESSLSPCIYSIIASEIGYLKQAYQLYLRASRLDLDNYNNDTEDGLHITSMGGTWLSIIHGFGGLRVKDGYLHLNPIVPDEWDEYSFRICFRQKVINVTVKKGVVSIDVEVGETFDIYVYNNLINVVGSKNIEF